MENRPVNVNAAVKYLYYLAIKDSNVFAVYYCSLTNYGAF